MGLNVYFCDVCGVRVTDVDLRSGHGMLRGQDVICATCLDMGHGKEWLASRGVSGPQAVVASGVAAASSGNGRAAGEGSAVRNASPAIIERLSAPFPPHHSDDEDTSFAPGVRHGADHAETGEVERPKRDTDYAGAAAGFAALGNVPAAVGAREDDDAVERTEPAAVDPTLLPASVTVDEIEVAPAGGVELEAADEPTEAEADDLEEDEEDAQEPLAPAALGARSDKASDRSSARNLSKSRGRAPSSDGKRPSNGAKAAKKGSSAAGKNSSAASKSTSSKFSKPKSSRTQKAAGGGMPLPLKISLITIPLILILGIGAYAGPSLVRGSKGGAVKDMQVEKNNIEKQLAETVRAVNGAVDSHDLKTLQSAHSTLLKFNNDFQTFCDNAKRYSNWTDEQCDTYAATLKIMDLNGRAKLLRDDMVKLENQSH